MIVEQFRCPVGKVGAMVAGVMLASNAGDYDLALDALSPTRDDTMIEVGFGAYAGRVAGLVGRYMGVDHSSLCCDMAPDGVSVGCADICLPGLPLRSAFTAALAVNTLQWWLRPDIGLLNIWNCLLPGGRFVVALAAAPCGALLPRGSYRHYSALEVEKMLIEAGFRDASVDVVATPRRPYLIGIGFKR